MRLRVSMPVHPHFRDLAVLRLAKDRAARVHPVAGAAPAVGAAELGREPGAGRIDLPRLERDLRLVHGDILPVVADGVDPDALVAEGVRDEYGVGRESGHDRSDVAALPPLAKRIQQFTISLVHGAQYTAIRNRRSERMVHGRRAFFRVSDTGGWNDVEADTRLHRRAGVPCAAPRGAGSHGGRGQRDDDDRSGRRSELLHDERRVGRRTQGVRAGVRQGGRAARHPGERRHDLRPGQLQAGRSAELEARAVHRGQGEGDGDAPHGERAPHDRDQDGLGRDLMRRTLGGGAAVLSAALLACGSRAPSGFTLLFLGRSPAASVDGLSWAPDPERSRLVAFDRQLHLARRLTSPRLGTPMAVAALPGGRLLVTERTGEGVVLDTAGRPVREWDSPDVASLYAASAGRIVAARSPYYVPELGSPEPDTAPLLRVLDTLGHPVEGLATIRVPAIPLLTHLVNAGAVAVGPDGSVYYAPLVRDEIRKYAPSGAPGWTTRRGLMSKESEPVFLPARGKELRLAKALVNVALALGPDGRLYALGADDSAATRLRVDVLDTATGAIVATRHL